MLWRSPQFLEYLELIVQQHETGQLVAKVFDFAGSRDLTMSPTISFVVEWTLRYNPLPRPILAVLATIGTSPSATLSV